MHKIGKTRDAICKLEICYIPEICGDLKLLQVLGKEENSVKQLSAKQPLKENDLWDSHAILKVVFDS